MSSALDQLVDKASTFLKVLAGRTRLQLLLELLKGEQSVGVLARQVDENLPAVSQQLAVLRGAGLVKVRRDGQLVYYSLSNERTEQLISELSSLFSETGSLCRGLQHDAALRE